MDIPALTLSGGSRPINSEDILEYRVWVHPNDSGDDYYYYAKNYDEILEIRKRHLNEGFVEKPLGVIKDPKGFREVVLK